MQQIYCKTDVCLCFIAVCDIMEADNQKSKAVGDILRKEVITMLIYETIMIIFVAMTFIVALIKLMIYIAENFSGKRK